MDQYENFLENYPDDNEVRPFLIQVYSKLNLTHLKNEELETYNEIKFGE